MKNCDLFHESILENDLKNWGNESDNIAVKIYCIDVLSIRSISVEDDFSIFYEPCVKTDQNVQNQNYW